MFAITFEVIPPIPSKTMMPATARGPVPLMLPVVEIP
jgi:hypothetical protein